MAPIEGSLALTVQLWVVVYNHWTGLVDWTSGLDWWTQFFLFVIHFSTYLGN